MMRKGLFGVIGGALCAIAFAAPANAQATRTWVSGVGDDANPCSRTAPCQTFAAAISKTAPSGEINCLDPGGFGGITITKSITIDCFGMFGSVLVGGANGVIVNGAGIKVRLRGLTINGIGTSGIGVNVLQASSVSIEDCEIFGFGATLGGTAGAGIRDTRTTGQTRLIIQDTTIQNNTAAGIVAAATNVNIVVLDNVRVYNNTYGLAAGNSNNVVVARSVFAGNSIAGLEADFGGQLNIRGSTLSHNNIGVQAYGTAYLTDSTISFSNQVVDGTLRTFGNNQLIGNGVLGGTLVPAGAASGDLGQQ